MRVVAVWCSERCGAPSDPAQRIIIPCRAENAMTLVHFERDVPTAPLDRAGLATCVVPFALPPSFEALIDEVRDACAPQRTILDAVAMSDGTSWSTPVLQRFRSVGLRAIQVPLDGPARVRDLARPSRHGRSFASILASLKYHRGEVAVVVRADPDVGVDGIEELASILDAERSFAPPNAVCLFVAARAPYPRQALQRLALTTPGAEQLPPSA